MSELRHSTEKHFGENNDGVHLMNGEYTLCGDAFDINAVDDEVSEVAATRKRVVTCVNCIAIIKLTKGVRCHGA